MKPKIQLNLKTKFVNMCFSREQNAEPLKLCLLAILSQNTDQRHISAGTAIGEWRHLSRIKGRPHDPLVSIMAINNESDSITGILEQGAKMASLHPLTIA